MKYIVTLKDHPEKRLEFEDVPGRDVLSEAIESAVYLAAVTRRTVILDRIEQGQKPLWIASFYGQNLQRRSAA